LYFRIHLPLLKELFFVRTKFVLRLILAFLFATFAVIFTSLIPPIAEPTSAIIKTLLTLAASLVGYLVFPAIAKSVKLITLSLFNFAVRGVSSEVLNQMLRIRQATHMPFSAPTPQVGAVALTKPQILDTSAIIDGRILDIAKTGFISGLVLVPEFVLTELQQVADSQDEIKRARGRRGFEIVEDLKKIKGVRLEVWDKEQKGRNVDEKLLGLAKSLHGRIVTTDFNLNKVASVSGLTVLNVNDLANAVKTVAVPGERISIKIMHLGKDPTQGVGYLTDGTMVVVSEAASSIGRELSVEVTKSLQIPAGRMIFAKFS
jgi:uncharacterized protein YacL